jgi:IS605 OrfB family transposase
MQDLTKTIKLRLYATPKQSALFRQMSEKYRQACNFVSQYIFENDFELNSTKLNKVLYREVRFKFALKSQLAQSTFRTATARYKTTQTQLAQKPYRYKDDNGEYQRINRTLEWILKPVLFRRPQCDLVRDRDYSFVDNGTTLSINTLEKRAKVKFAGDFWAEYLDGSWNLGTAKLLNLKGIWYLHISATKKFEEFDKEKIQHVVGIDRGLRFLAVTYDEHGKTDFKRGKQILRKRHSFFKVRRQLQAKGTKSAKRALQRISGRENRWMSDVNHCLSKTLVEKYGSNTLFVLEDLTGISFEETNLNRGKKANNDLRSWAFYQLEQFLAYKSHEVCSEVLKVSAKYTSQRCPKCGSINKLNRHHHTHEYICQCGYRSNDDRIGAMNIQILGTLWISGEDRPHFEKITACE